MRLRLLFSLLTLSICGLLLGITGCAPSWQVAGPPLFTADRSLRPVGRSLDAFWVERTQDNYVLTAIYQGEDWLEELVENDYWCVRTRLSDGAVISSNRWTADASGGTSGESEVIANYRTLGIPKIAVPGPLEVRGSQATNGYTFVRAHGSSLTPVVSFPPRSLGIIYFDGNRVIATNHPGDLITVMKSDGEAHQLTAPADTQLVVGNGSEIIRLC